MANIIIPNGVSHGAPGPVGSPSTYAFADSGDPNLIADPLKLLANCNLGSTFQRIDQVDSTHQFYVKTGISTSANVNGIWTNK